MPEKAKSVRLWQEITLALALKFFVLFVIWAVWFSVPEDATLNDQAVASKILSQQLNKDHDHDAVP
jgi:hypothetical protein